MPITLIQISDVHLGRSFGGLAIDGELRRELETESIEAVRRACALARERDAAAVLVAGDLFDRPELDPFSYDAVRAAFEAVELPVLVSPGNHDAFGPASVWNRRTLERLGLPAWSSNVHVFETRALSTHELLDGALLVHGHRVEGHHGLEDSPLTAVELPSRDALNVLLVHAALTSQVFEPRRTTVPFTIDQLAGIGADYTAVGHYHRFRRIEHEGRLLGAYAGVPVPGAIDEDPHGGIAVVTLVEGRAEVECVTTYPGRIRRVAVTGDRPFESDDDAVERVLEHTARDGMTATDIVFVDLDGFSRVELSTTAVTEALREAFRSVKISDRTEPEELTSTAGGRERTTVESQFHHRLREQIEGCDDPERRRLLELALRYGRHALRGRRPRPAEPAAPETPEPSHAS